MYPKVYNSINNIKSEEWDKCALNKNTDYNPFCSYGFLSALEESKCAISETGWHAQHITLEDEDGTLFAAMPLYLKSHSYGEYVFDHGWANAFEQAGGKYYPKLQSSVPFSPITGNKLLISPEDRNHSSQNMLVKFAIEHTKKFGISSLHYTFLNDDEIDVMTSNNLLIRNDQQFHWFNQNYNNFNDFLSTLSSRKRKNIRKERRQISESDVEIEILEGNEITEEHWDHYFRFYIDTANRKWGQPYLNREFFSLISKKIPNNLLLFMAKCNGKYIAGALNLKSDNILYGRYWGALEHHPFLHFELCYYQAIEYAIAHNITKIEAGAQGEHKLARGYVPVLTKSAHWINNPSFKEAISDFLERERELVMDNADYLKSYSPYKNE